MGNRSRIEWTDAIWNPVTGCTTVSLGCAHCYAERLFPRLYGHHNVPDTASSTRATRPRTFTDVAFHPERLEQPLRWHKPRRIVVCSTSDLFHRAVPDDCLFTMFGTMAATPQHTYLILTKRVERMQTFLVEAGQLDNIAHEAERLTGYTRCFLDMEWPLPNIWLGVSVEDQWHANLRIPRLLHTPAAVRWISYEPAIGPVDFRAVPLPDGDTLGVGLFSHGDGNGIDWIVCGGESGPHARPMQIAWIENVVHQCQAAHVPIFVKQDAGPRPGMQGRIPDHLWIKHYPPQRTSP